MENVVSEQSGVSKSIPPMSQSLEKCGLMAGAFEMEATVAIEGTYRTLIFNRNLRVRNFKWLKEATPPRWAEDGSL